VIYTRANNERNDDSERRRCIQEGLPDVVETIQRLWKSYSVQRHEMMIELMQREIELNRPNRFSRMLHLLRRVIKVPAGSIFVAAPKTDLLECIATSGFLVDPDDASAIHFGSSHYAYDISKHVNSFTVSCALHPWEPVRMNRTDDPTEKGLPGWAPSQPMSLFAEAIHGSLPKKRRLLMVGFDTANGYRGVVRLVRRQKDPPFLACDEKLVLEAVRTWRSAIDKGGQRTYSQLQQTICSMTPAR
jgi:hypothetical protein